MEMTIGKRIAALRREKNLKQDDLAQIMELVRHGAVGNLVEVESADGDTVRIFVE